MNHVIRGYTPRGTRLLLLSSFLATVPLGYLIVVLPLYLARVGIEPAVIGGFSTASRAMTAVLVAFSGVLADRWGRRRFLIAGALLPKSRIGQRRFTSRAVHDEASPHERRVRRAFQLAHQH